MQNDKILIETPQEAFDVITEAINHYIEKQPSRQDNANKLKQSIASYINKHYEVRSPMFDTIKNKKFKCKNGTIVELIRCTAFIASTSNPLTDKAMEQEWNYFGKADDEEFDIVGEV